jgi:5,10-methylenetetrahydromethanopterin reductase
MKFSIRLNNDLPVAQYIELAQLAEQYEFDQFWVSHDLFLRSCIVILSAIATATKRIEIGSCILNPYTINPAEIAMLATTLDELSRGRFNLGLSSGAGDFLEWVGIEQKKPRTDLLEVVDVLRRLFAGEQVTIDGQFVQWTDKAYLRFQPLRQIPIYIGAMSPKMLQAIGSHADGGLPLLFPPEHYANVAPLVAQGAETAQRQMADIDLAACIWCSFDNDREIAKTPLKEKIAYYGHAMSPMILQQLGLTLADFDEIEHVMQTERDVQKAISLVTDEMLKIGVTGTPQDILPRLEALVQMGVNHLSFGPPLGVNIADAIRLIGEEIIPHFRR